MIELPKRSLTRFFVPLIDVLILLFCIFLLLPFVSKPEVDKGIAETDSSSDDPMSWKDRAQIAEAMNKALLADRSNTADRMTVVVLEISPENGKLYDTNKDSGIPKLVEIRNQAEAQAIIERHKQIVNGKSVHFLIQISRKPSGYPTQTQLDEYRRWFQEVPLTFDNPWSTK